jgi:hypothetical protein
MSVLFLSHSSHDRAEADRLRTDLLRLGYEDVFLDNHSLVAGDQWSPAYTSACVRVPRSSSW